MHRRTLALAVVLVALTAGPAAAQFTTPAAPTTGPATGPVADGAVTTTDDGMGNETTDDGMGTETMADDGMDEGTMTDDGMGTETMTDDGMDNGTMTDDMDGAAAGDGSGLGTLALGAAFVGVVALGVVLVLRSE